MLKLLFVDDEPRNIDIFRSNYEEEYDILAALNGVDALKIYDENPDIGLIVSDHKMPGMTGVELLTRIYGRNPDSVRIIVTAYSDFQSIFDAINDSHIFHYVLKPWDPQLLGVVLERAAYQWQLVMENQHLLEEQRRMNQQQRILSKNLVDAQENERKRISMELHDDIGQNLMALKLQVGNLNREMQGQGLFFDDHVAIIKETLRKTIDSTRNLSRNLSPVILEDLGFDLGFEELLHDFQRDFGVRIEGSFLPLQDVFCKDQLRQLFRIFQEIFNNIGKHSGTERIAIKAEVSGSFFFCEIRDFGCGFEVEKELEQNGYSSKHSMGLANINERVTVLGGKVSVDSEISKGSRYVLCLPVQKTDGSQQS